MFERSPSSPLFPYTTLFRSLDDGDDAGALPPLARYVAAHPEHVTIRAHLAELLLKLKKPGEAREQLERYVADAQVQGEPRSEEHTSELQSLRHLVCRLLLEK